MTDKERHVAAMEENHRLREELKDWKGAYNIMVNESIKHAAIIITQADQIHKLKISTAHALSRWAQATRIWYKLKGYAGLAERYEKIHKRFFKVYIDLKTKPKSKTKKPAED